VRSPLRDDQAVQLYFEPDVGAMRAAAQVLSGRHDFTSFSSVRTDKDDKVRTIQIDIESDGDEIIFHVTGDGFLRNMVRIIVGTLLEVGQGKRTVDDVRHALLARDRMRAGQTAPAKGLCLVRVEYELGY